MRQEHRRGKQLTAVLLWLSLGIITHRFLNHLLPPWFIWLPLSLWVSSLVITPGLYRKGIRIVAWFVTGLLWANATATPLLNNMLPRNIEKKDIVIHGVITTIPENKEHYARFDFMVESINHEGKSYDSVGLIRLKAYANQDQFRVNQHWRLTVRLKRPQSYQNPGSHFNYETYLFQNRIRAVGYIREQPQPELLPTDSASPISSFRQKVVALMHEQFGHHPHFGILTALLVGVKDGITPDHWKVLQRTGTIHLVAISGLHIGLIAALVVMLSSRLWRLCGPLKNYLPAPRFALLCGLVAATIYALLAGMTIPTRRALAMLFVVVVAALCNRRPSSWEVITLVLFAVLVIDPLAPLSTGFWLSFGAVIAIILSMQWRQPALENNLFQRTLIKTQNWTRVQIGIFVGMMPLLLTLFGQTSLISPIANLFAIPMVGLVVVPIALVGLFLLSVGLSYPALLVFELCLSLLTAFWQALDWMSGIGGVWQVSSITPVLLICCIAGVAMWFAPRALLPRWLGICWLTPLLLHQPEKLAPHEFRYTMLEVGHGLASVIETRNHVLVYDTGPGSAGGMNAGSMIVNPFLIARGITHIDAVIVSHEHNDHIGGYRALKERFRIHKTLVGVKHSIVGATPCEAGNGWQWDGVNFDVLWPLAHDSITGNNASCVVKVSSKHGSLLLTGDIEKAPESWLTTHRATDLKSDLLQVPHQGSRTSSTSSFLLAVDPDYALVSTGYLNRFSHPHDDVKQRYADHRIPFINTAYSGAIEVLFDEHLRITEFRDLIRGYWFARDGDANEQQW